MCRILCYAVVVLCLTASSALADSLYGTIKYKDGSKDKGTARIETSWNSARGRNDGMGNYKIDFKEKVGKKITVYVNGTKYIEIVVNGDTKLNITIP